MEIRHNVRERESSLSMHTEILERTYIPHLSGQFANGSVVLFLGAGFSLEARNHSGTHVPTVSQLTKDLWELCFPGESFDDTTQVQDIFENALLQHPKELGKLFKRSFSVDPGTCPEWYRSLLSMPWLRIYTLNIDNLVEEVLSTGAMSREFHTVSATTRTEPLFIDSRLPIVHLNGALGTTYRMSHFRGLNTDSARVSIRPILNSETISCCARLYSSAQVWRKDFCGNTSNCVVPELNGGNRKCGLVAI